VVLSLALVGDVMLGRLVDGRILADPTTDPAHVWGDTKPLLAQADLCLANLECVIATRCYEHTRAPKTFTFCARPRAIEALQAVPVDFVSLANNHVLDYGADALLEMLDRLEAHGIAWAGAGPTMAAALRPAIIPAGEITVGVLSLTDNEPGWEAGLARAGTNYVDYDDHGLREPYRRRIAQAMAETRQRADLIIVSAHVGPNWGPPSPAMQVLARQLIDFGADLYWGHSNHTVQGIELYRGRPILYSTGDFVDDYAVDPHERNDLSCIFQVMVEDKQIRRLRLHPVKIGYLQVNRATGEDAAWITLWLRARCTPFGTQLQTQNGELQVDLERGLSGQGKLNARA
jgi:poly-gamma-glutamate capsule biosynthesis protein CapA/YwtB (metallophosphatase superfamily)